ncbi:MAG: hypothetical protein Q4P66_03525, partial [Actinomycetaceae bacterium]|nr:hypothetical protein [Actinomycetaceae bacterium]
MKTKESDAHYWNSEHHSVCARGTTESHFPSRTTRKRQHSRVKYSSLKTIIKKPAAVVAAMALLLTGLVALLQPTAAQANDWPFAGKPGTAQGYVFNDVAGDVEYYNRALGDTAIPGVV